MRSLGGALFLVAPRPPEVRQSKPWRSSAWRSATVFMIWGVHVGAVGKGTDAFAHAFFH